MKTLSLCGSIINQNKAQNQVNRVESRDGPMMEFFFKLQRLICLSISLHVRKTQSSIKKEKVKKKNQQGHILVEMQMKWKEYPTLVKSFSLL